MAQVEECLPSKLEVLSMPSPPKKIVHIYIFPIPFNSPQLSFIIVCSVINSCFHWLLLRLYYDSLVY
jgi:hypothetical protein